MLYWALIKIEYIMTNKQEFQYRLEKNLKNNLSLRLLKKAQNFIIEGQSLRSSEWDKAVDCSDIEPKELLYKSGVSIFLGMYLEHYSNEDDFWNDEYQKLDFTGGQVILNPIDYIDYNAICDQIIYGQWCMFSQFIKCHETNLKQIK